MRMSYPTFIVDVEFVWGFQARIIGLSKTSPSFYYPPPTTFLGALAESVAREIKVGEEVGKEVISSLGRNLLAIGFKPINCVPLKYEDLNKIIAVKITSGIPYPDPRNLAASYDSPARGKTLMSSLNENAPTLRFLLVFRRDNIELNSKDFPLREDHFWRIHRLGSKESRVSVTHVERKAAEVIPRKEARTEYSFPVFDGVNPIKEVERKWYYEVYVNPRDVKYSSPDNPLLSYMESRSLIPYRIPILVTMRSPPQFLVEAGGSAALYRVGDEVIVGWKE